MQQRQQQLALAACLTGLSLALLLSAVQRRRRRRPRLTFYDRKSSNNSARIRLWAYLRDREDLFTVQPTTHTVQRTDEFESVNPFLKVPALILEHADGSRGFLAEAAIMLEYLEDAHGPWIGPSLLPTVPETRAHMNLVIRCHDLYLASPNCTQPGPFTHSQGCMYVAPPGGKHCTDRWIGRAERAAKLAECWKQLDVLESLMRGPYFCGARQSLADLAVYPTMVFFAFYPQRVFGWAEDALWHGRPKLRAWYETAMPAHAAARRVHDELLETLHAKAASGILDEIVEETRDPAFKWVYP